MSNLVGLFTIQLLLLVANQNVFGRASDAVSTSTMRAPAQTSLSDQIHELANQLCALSTNVSAEEAQRVASCAYVYSMQLAREYHVVRPALFHNLLINIGLKKRGLCYQWAEDLVSRLQTLQLSTLELHWGKARQGTWREHNTVVVTARGQPFREGIVLDAWRHSGNLVWAHVASDKYPWQEGKL